MTPSIVMHQVQAVPITRISRAPWNANVTSDKTLEKIRRSLKRYGSVENSVVRPTWCIGARTAGDLAARKAAQMDEVANYETLSGNHRHDLYREEGVTHVPCVVVELADAEARVLAQTLNRTRGEDDEDKLKSLLKEVIVDIPPVDVAGLLPQTEQQLRALLNTFAGTDAPRGDDPGAEDPPKDPVSKRGEIYLLGPHVLMCGSSTDETDVAKLMDGKKSDMVWTDPPYGVAYVGKNEAAMTIDNDALGKDGTRELWRDSLGLAHTHARDGACIFATGPSGDLTLATLNGFADSGWRLSQTLVWEKDVFVLGRMDYHYRHETIAYGWKEGAAHYVLGDRTLDSIHRCPRPKASLEHPTMKPVELIERHLRHHSQRGWLIHDPFGGSGSTLIACARMERVCRTMEIDPRFCDVIRKRWGDYARTQGIPAGPGAL